ncbi:polyprotein precursor, partial [GB virus-D]
PRRRSLTCGKPKNPSGDGGGHLFLLTAHGVLVCCFTMARLVLLFLLAGAASAGRLARQVCRVGSSVFLTNCCSEDDVYYCLSDSCMTAEGCVICTQGQCWESTSPGFSHRPGSDPGGFPKALRGHYGTLVLSAYGASVLGLGEVYSLGLCVLVGVTYGGGSVPPLVCDLDCNITWHGDAWQIAQAAVKLGTTVERIAELPWRVAVGLYNAGLLVCVLCLLFCLEGRVVMAVLLLLSTGLAEGKVLPARRGCNKDPTFDSCVCSPPKPYTTHNSTQVCTCPFADLYWLGISARFWGVVGRDWKPPGFCCPRKVRTPAEVWCQVGSTVWGHEPLREYDLDIWNLVPNGSATCWFYLGSNVIYVCVVDRRPKWCGTCTQDCTLETGDPRLTFEACGLGPKLTRHLTAVGANIWDPIVNTPWVGRKRPSNPGVRGPVSDANYLVTQIGTTYHAFGCPKRPHPRLPSLIPGKPVNSCAAFSGALWDLDLGIPRRLLTTCLATATRAGTVSVCDGFAWRVPRDGDHFIHVKGSWQETNTGWLPSPWWLLCDLFFVLLYLMKVSGAKLIPALFFAIWYQCGMFVSAFPVPVVMLDWWNDTIASAPWVKEAYERWAQNGTINATLLLNCNLIPCDAVSLGVYESDVYLTSGVRFAVGTGSWLWDSAVNASKRLQFFVNPTAMSWLARSSLNLTSALGVHFNLGDVGSWIRSWNWTWSGRPTLPPPPTSPSPAPEPLTARLQDLLTRLLQALAELNRTVGAEAAVHPAVVAGPMFVWALGSVDILGVVFGLLALLFYLKGLGPARLSALVAIKLSRGFVGVLVLLALARGRPWSVLGYSVCFEITHDTSFHMHWFWNFVAFLIFFACVSFSLLTPYGKRLRLDCFFYWARAYAWLVLKVEDSPVGKWGRPRQALWLWPLCCYIFPTECIFISLTLICLAAAIDVLDWVIETMFICQVDVHRLAHALDRWSAMLSMSRLDRVLTRCGARGIWLYDHMGQVPASLAERLRAFGGALEPAYVTGLDLERIKDDARVLACGSSVRGKPVVARRGDEVLIGTVRGLEELPPGFTLSAPLVVRTTGRGFFSVMTTSMLGRDSKEHEGSIMVLGTATTRSMGTCLGGVMYTTFHSSRARTLAGPSGPLNPRWWSTSDDTVVYPLPLAARSLEPCGCSPSSAWVVRNDGALCHGQLLEKGVRLDVSLRVSDFEGSSGSPILCDAGHAIGMLVSVRHRGPVVHEAVFNVPWKTMPKEVTSQMEPPCVPKEGFVEAPLFVPTGSGKSTKIPHGYAQKGHNVLVINPSVATTMAMGPYMKKLTGSEPSVYAGHGPTAYSRTTDSKLTYCTYGRFLTQPVRFLKWADVVVCDEAHSMDSTTVLGIGLCRALAKGEGVKLVLYATATPAGAPVTAHPRIREIQLTGEGDLDFYGFRIPTKRYLKGRHLVFCHSKELCRMYAQEFTKAGCRAMYFYRGCDPGSIPDTGDLVVVATDALMTGYTGDFDTVTDCGVSVREEVTVTLDPTITIALCSGPATADVRMQRRGRCGRGREGTYYFCLDGAAPSGVVPSGTVWGAVEAAVVWYGLKPSEAADALRVYGACPYTAHVSGNLGDAVVFCEGLVPYAHDAEVTRCKAGGVQWPLLTGVQRRMCLEGDAEAPDSDPRWAGVVGKNPTPLLCRWGHRAPERIAPHHIVDDLVRRLGAEPLATDTYVTPVLVVGVGVAAACAIAGATGSLVVVTSWVCGGGGSPVALATLKTRGVSGHDPTPIPPLGAEGIVKTPSMPSLESGESTPSDIKKTKQSLEVVTTQMGWDALAGVWSAISGQAAKVTTEAQQAWMNWGRVGGDVASLPKAAAANAAWKGTAFVTAWTQIQGYLTEITTAGVALWTAGRNPPLAICSSLVLGLQTHLPLDARIAAGLLIGALGGSLGTPAVGAGMTAAYVMGGGIRGMPVLGYLFDILCGWEAVATCASVVFDLLGGTAKMSDAWYCLAAIGSPGAGVAGAAIGILLHLAFSSAPSEKWLNRLLTMLPRGSALPDDYFEHSCLRERASNLLKRMSLARLIAKILERQEEVHLCGWDMLTDFLSCVRRFVTWLYNWIADSLSLYRAPLLTCQRGFTGEWEGDGEVVATCGCGATVMATIRAGHVFDLKYSSWLCTNSFRHAIPVNTRLKTSGPKPKVKDGLHVYRLGFTQYVWVQKKDRWGEVVGASISTFTRADIRQAVRMGPCYVDGESVCFSNSFEGPARLYGPKYRVTVDGENSVLPVSVSFLPDEEGTAPSQVLRPKAPPLPPGRNPLPPCCAEYAPRLKEGLTTAKSPAVMQSATTSEVGSLPIFPRSLGTGVKASAGDSSTVDVSDTVCRDCVPGSVDLAPVLQPEEPVYQATVEPVAAPVLEEIPLGEAPLVPPPASAVSAVVAATTETVLAAASNVTVVAAAALSCAGKGLKAASVGLGARPKKRPSADTHKIIYKGPVPATRNMVKVKVEMPCCEKSSRRVVDGALTVKELLTLVGWDYRGHQLYDEDGTPVEEDCPVSELGNGYLRLSELSETKCGLSYLWSGAGLECGLSKAPPVTRPVGKLLSADATKAYITDMRDVAVRISKVTKDRKNFVPDKFFNEVYQAARGSVKRLGRNPRFSYEEAVAKVRPGAAPGHNVKLSVADLKTPRGRDIVLRTIESIRRRDEKHPFMLTAKQEVFFQDKKTLKPPRLICYPSLEFRVAEKMILGDPSVVAKAIMGKAYGFQYTPVQRVGFLMELWKSKKKPAAITVDAICFDSCITPEDVERETELYALASDDPELVRSLGSYYAGGTMINRRGVVVGERACRASGVLTTSSSNCISSFLKVSAACRKIGLRDPSFLIHGDDVMIIFEREAEDPCSRLKEALADYGYPCEPQYHASLDTAQSCSAWVAECSVWGGDAPRRHYFLSTDFRRVLARSVAEYGDPVAAACGYCLLYPQHPIVRHLLLPQLLSLPFYKGESVDARVVCEVSGNKLTFPLKLLPSILVGIHGPDCLRVVTDSTSTLTETHKALQAFKLKGLSYYRRKTAVLRVSLLRKGGEWAKLARTLLWGPQMGPPPIVEPRKGSLEELMTHPYQGTSFDLTVPDRGVVGRRDWRLVACCAAVLLLAILI